MKYTFSEYMSENFIEDILLPFLQRAKTKRTAVEYVGYLRILSDYLQKDFLDITEEDASHVFDNWRGRVFSGTLSKKTVCVRLSCYRSLSKYIMEEYGDLYPNFINPFEDIERPEINDSLKYESIPSMEEIDAIFSQAQDDKMYYLILSLATRACLPSSKITKITRSSISIDDNIVGLHIKDSKGNENFIVLPDDVGELLLTYLDELTSVDEAGHIFYNKHGHPLTIKNLDTRITQLVNAAGLENHYTLKDLRARGILEMAKAGASEQAISSYTELGAIRLSQFAQAKGYVGDCPANLVNFRIKTS